MLIEHWLYAHIVLTQTHILMYLIATSVKNRDSFYSAIIYKETDAGKQCHLVPKHYR